MKLSVKLKLQIGFGVILLFLLIISGIGMFYLNENNRVLDQIEEEQKIVELYNDIAFQAVRANAAVRGYMLYEKDEMEANHYEIREELHAAIDQLQSFNIDKDAFHTYLEQLGEWEDGIDNEIFPLQEIDPAAAEQAALPILGEGSRLLVSYGKTMANEMTAEIEKSIEQTQESGQSKFTMMLILSIIAMAISFTISTFFGRRIAKNINEVVQQMSEFATGNFLTKLNLKTKDEFEQLSDSFNEMTDQLSLTMREVGNSSEQVAATAEELTASSNEVNHATEIVTESVQDISHGIDRQNQMTTEVNALSENVRHKMNDIANNIQYVNKAALETKSRSGQGQGSVDSIMEQMNIISENTSTLTTGIKELDDNTNLIVEAVNVIKGIAEQTNLLAINASIEAARSGEHGKGFAVVATEVRNLADESRRAATDIEHMVTTITAHTEKIVEDIIVNEESVKTGRDRVTMAHESFSTIDTSIDDVQQQTEAVMGAIQQISHDITALVEGINEIHHVSEQTTDSIQSVAASTEEQMASMEEVAAASTHLAEMAIQLQETIQSFKY